jgi:hypothetical protein
MSMPTASEYDIIRDRLSDRTYRLRLQPSSANETDTEVTWQAAIALFQQSHPFRSALTMALAETPFSAFFWETPPITPRSLSRPWECVVVDAPSLASIEADPDPFNAYLSRHRQSAIVTFPNLGGDALLVVPCEQGERGAYAHLARFVRQAPTTQVHQFWQILGQTIQQHVIHRAGRSLWVSTSGLGVYWLHARLDDVPKYYAYAPYQRDACRS